MRSKLVNLRGKKSHFLNKTVISATEKRHSSLRLALWKISNLWVLQVARSDEPHVWSLLFRVQPKLSTNTELQCYFIIYIHQLKVWGSIKDAWCFAGSQSLPPPKKGNRKTSFYQEEAWNRTRLIWGVGPADCIRGGGREKTVITY